MSTESTLSKLLSSGAYGGMSGNGASHTATALPYGLATAPYLPGSSGGNGRQTGGGAIRISANTIRSYGIIDVTGALGGGSYGGGSGGSIWLTCIRYRTSATSVTRADGGANNNNESGGGGGRICIANGLRASQIAELYTTGAASGRHTVVDLADPEVVVGDYVQFTISAAAPMRVACRFLSIRGSRHGVSRSGAGSEKRL